MDEHVGMDASNWETLLYDLKCPMLRWLPVVIQNGFILISVVNQFTVHINNACNVSIRKYMHLLHPLIEIDILVYIQVMLEFPEIRVSEKGLRKKSTHAWNLNWFKFDGFLSFQNSTRIRPILYRSLFINAIGFSMALYTI